MHVWMVLFSLWLNPSTEPAASSEPAAAEPMRYRGIEKLLAKFEAEATAPAQNR